MRARRAAAVLGCTLVCASLTTPASAQQAYSGGRLYGEIGLAAGAVRVADLDFYPALATITAGAFLLPGIGLELFADGGWREGTDDDFQLEVEHGFGAALRLESPPADGLSGYVVLGYAGFRVRQDIDEDRGRTGDIVEDFRGARISIGLVQRLTRVPALSLAAEYRKYYVDDGLGLDALVLSLRVSAP